MIDNKNETEIYSRFEKFVGTNPDVSRLINLSPEELNEAMKGNVSDLNYEQLLLLLPQGSDNEKTATILKNKREEYLVRHPEMRVASGASEGIIGCDGIVIPMDQWNKMTPEKKFEHVIGRTCSHYNADVPGYGPKGGME